MNFNFLTRFYDFCCTITQHRIQELFTCCGFENLTQYCKKPQEFISSLQQNFKRNEKISQKDNYDEDKYEELFDSSDLKTHLQDDSCGMVPTQTGDQSFCPDEVFRMMKENKAIDERHMFDHGCGDAVAEHFRDVMEYVLLQK